MRNILNRQFRMNLRFFFFDWIASIVLIYYFTKRPIEPNAVLKCFQSYISENIFQTVLHSMITVEVKLGDAINLNSWICKQFNGCNNSISTI